MSVHQICLTNELEYGNNQTFGEYGSFRCREFKVNYAVDPQDPHNTSIVGLDQAPKNKDGLVEFNGEARLILPSDSAPKALLVDIPNRGRVISFSFNRPSVQEATSTPYPVGDGFLWCHGFALLSIAWQTGADGLHLNVPEATKEGKRIQGQVACQMQPGRKTQSLFYGQGGPAMYQSVGSGRLFVRSSTREPLIPIDRNRWRFGRIVEGELTNAEGFISLDGGFEKGKIYTLVYDAIGASVVGLGLLAVRDAVSFFRYNYEGWSIESPKHTISYGASQTGRFLRHFLYENLNQDESDRPVFDAVIPHIAGGQRGDFNHQFAQPGSMGVLSAGQRFPFSTKESHDPLSGKTSSLLQNCANPPKLLITNTSWEYWRGDAALAHVSTDGSQDLEPNANERIYMFAGCHHINAVWPPSDRFMLTGEQVAYSLNTISFAPLIRAVLINALQWVSEGIEPPESSYPRITDGSLVDRDTVIEAFKQHPEFKHLPDADELTGLWFTDLGGQVADGICALPAIQKAPYPSLVSTVTEDFNEIAGIRLPEISIPIGIHTGWNPRHSDHGAPQQNATFAGFSKFDEPASVPATLRECQKLVEDATSELVQQRFVLEEDAELVISNALSRHEFAQDQHSVASTTE